MEKFTANNKAVFEVEFDSEAWASMTSKQKDSWIDQVTDSINDHARVSAVFIGGK